ncbi:MAG TPA: type II secretion system F family protein [Nitrospiria bacterium]
MFFMTCLAVFGAAYLIMRQRIVQNRLQKALNDSISESIDQVGLEAHNASLTSLAAKWLSSAVEGPGRLILPKEQWERSHIQSQLVMAGYRRPYAFSLYQGTRVLLAALLPSLFLASRLIIGVAPMMVITLSLGLTALGLYLPAVFLRMKISQRQNRISKALPNALDMIMVCVEAGQGLDAAVHQVAVEMEHSAPDISEEMQLTSLELRGGKSRVDAFKNLGTRTGVDEVQALAALLVQTDRFGTNLVNALRVHADGTRTKRRQKLEEEAAKTSVKLIFPLVFFIFPAILVVMAGPAFIRILRVMLPAMGGN